jgi:hypothetical protein
MTSFRTRCWAGAAAILSSALLASLPPTVRAEPARLLNNSDQCIQSQESIFYGRSSTNCPKNDLLDWKCREDGCCCKDACSQDCQKSYCRLKAAYWIDPRNYCGNSIQCQEEWKCRPGPGAVE